MKRLVELKSGLAIDRLEGEGGDRSPFSIKMHGQVVGWLTTYGDVPTLIVSPKAEVKLVTVPDRGYTGVELHR